MSSTTIGTNQAHFFFLLLASQLLLTFTILFLQRLFPVGTFVLPVRTWALLETQTTKHRPYLSHPKQDWTFMIFPGCPQMRSHPPAGQGEDCSFLPLSLAVSRLLSYLKYCLCQRKIKVLDVGGWEDIWGSLTWPVYSAEGEDPERKRESPGATPWLAMTSTLPRYCCYHEPSINILLQTWQWPLAKNQLLLLICYLDISLSFKHLCI